MQKIHRGSLWRIGAFLAFMLPSLGFSATLNLSTGPLYVTQPATPMTMLVVSKDQSLFTGAYLDTTDLTGAGVLANVYRPGTVDYYGYFDSHTCYNYSGGQFTPSSITSTKMCSGRWSGDFLNYITMSRMDVIRMVLYGGTRSTDTSSQTILERAYIPQESHSFGHQYTSVAVDGYDIRSYTPLSLPGSSNHILFANTTLASGTAPLMRVITNTPYEIWDWISSESPEVSNRVINGTTGPSVSPTDYIVRVSVCNSSSPESFCQLYPNGNYKPVGILQQFGQNDSMYFGLLTGSYDNNLQGGALRKNIGTITNEMSASNGVYTSTVGIVKTLDRLEIVDFNGSSYSYDNCGFIFNRSMVNGECKAWGNPVAEMMYESLRYFAGKSSATASFKPPTSGTDASLGLPVSVSWINPYTSTNWCAKSNMLVVSSANASFDTDQVPGSYFGSFSGDLTGFNGSTLANTIWGSEKGGSGQYFIGQSGTVSDNAPTPKTVSSFANIRGLAPDQPTKQGGYYAASVANFGWLNDLSAVTGTQNVKTYVLAVDTTVPKIIIPVTGGTVTMIPFAKSIGAVGSCLGSSNPTATQGSFQPTDDPLTVYVQSITPTSGTFLVSFADTEQGADYDMDALVTYSYVVNSNNTVTITVDSTYAAGCVIQHLGYVISGTTHDGVYLEVRDLDTPAANDVNYYLDTPPGQLPGGNWNNSAALPTTTSRIFTPSGTLSAQFLQNPLYYAAKWGGFNDKNGNNIPDQTTEWDTDQNGSADNYFLVQSPTNLKTQLTNMIQNIVNRSSSASAAAFNAGSLSSTSYLYQATFNTGDWSGHLLAFPINSTTGALVTTGSALNGAQWDAATPLTAQTPASRTILTYKPSSKIGIPFQWVTSGTTSLDSAQQTALNKNPNTGSADGLGSSRLSYLRGQAIASFRTRTNDLGDIVDSNPIYVGAPNSLFPDTWVDGGPETSYSTFKTSKANRQSIVYVGANDGMLHGFDATSGAEELAYIPNTVFSTLNLLTSTNYQHQFYVDGPPTVGDVFYNSAWHTVLVGGLRGGGQGIYALDITNPSNFTEGNASSLVLWEYSDSNDSGMGYTFSQPQIGRMANGKWVAVFGNGYNNTATGNASTTGNAILYIVDIQTGALIKKIDTGEGMNDDPLGTNRPNGLATPVLVSTQQNNIVDVIYAGDLFGNLWKFDVSSTSTANWKVAFSGSPLFTATVSGVAQPITVKPAVGFVPGQVNTVGIYFGTGKYLESADKIAANGGQQSFYGLFDNGSSPITGRSQLLPQQISSEVTASGNTFRVTTNNTLTTQRGWYMDLGFAADDVGERVTSDPLLRDGKIIFTTLIPAVDVCSYGGTGWLMVLNASNGGRLTSLFDVNADGGFTSNDTVTVGQTQVSPSGVQSQIGILPTPGILSMNGKDIAFIPGSNGGIAQIAQSQTIPQQRQSWRQIR